MLQSLNLPDWLPWWVPLALLVPALLWALSFLFMPFSVFGVKSRLEVIEARLEEIQNEIRHVALRLPRRRTACARLRRCLSTQNAEPRIADRVMTPPAGSPWRATRLERCERQPTERQESRRPPVSRRLRTGRRPSPNARPVRRNNEPLARPDRAEPRLDWRR